MRCLLLLLLFAACAGDPQPSAQVAAESLDAGGPGTAGVRRAYETYRTWGRVDEPARWAPTMCMAPPPPARARRSASGDRGTHGRKLYSLFARDRVAYQDEGLALAPIGQVLAKEAWLPVEIEPSELPELFPAANPGDLVDGWLPYARSEDGRAWKAGERGALFLMMKLDPQEPGTDEGWLYATVEPDGQVTSMGALESCIECHRRAPRDRQFGLPHDLEDSGSPSER